MTATVDTPDTPDTPDTVPPAAGPATEARRRRRRRGWAVVTLVALLGAALGWYGYRALTPHIYAGTVMQAPAAAPPMDGLVWSDGSPVDLGELRGDLVLVYFGYTFCPDVCPTTLATIDRALDRLGDDAGRVHVMMVSVDPERDQPSALGDYVRSFDPAFRGATGEPADIERVASTYGVFFARGVEYDDGGYAVDHTASLMGIDTDGHLRIVWPTTVTADVLADDLGELL